MERKKQLILLVLKLLEANSDENHPLTQIAITKMISDVYPCDRKTVGRNIKFLIEIGYPIVKTTKGFYMKNKVFSVDEIVFVKEAIMASKDMDIGKRQELANQVVECISKRYSQ